MLDFTDFIAFMANEDAHEEHEREERNESSLYSSDDEDGRCKMADVRWMMVDGCCMMAEG